MWPCMVAVTVSKTNQRHHSLHLNSLNVTRGGFAIFKFAAMKQPLQKLSILNARMLKKSLWQKWVAFKCRLSSNSYASIWVNHFQNLIVPMWSTTPYIHIPHPHERLLTSEWLSKLPGTSKFGNLAQFQPQKFPVLLTPAKTVSTFHKDYQVSNLEDPVLSSLSITRGFCIFCYSSEEPDEIMTILRSSYDASRVTNSINIPC